MALIPDVEFVKGRLRGSQLGLGGTDELQRPAISIHFLGQLVVRGRLPNHLLYLLLPDPVHLVRRKDQGAEVVVLLLDGLLCIGLLRASEVAGLDIFSAAHMGRARIPQQGFADDLL